MVRNGVVFLLLLCSIEPIVGPYCNYYPSYPSSYSPSYSKYCSDRCCTGFPTTSSSACCEDTSYTNTFWIVPVAVVCSLVGLCIIIGIITTVICVLQSKKRRPVINPAYQNPLVATPFVGPTASYTAYPMTTTAITTPYGFANQNNYYPAQYNMPQPSISQPVPYQQQQDNAPPSYDTFTRQATTVNLSTNNQLPVLPASINPNQKF